MSKRLGKHTSTNRDIRRPVDRLLHQDGVVRVVLGPFHNCRHTHTIGSLRYQSDIDAGVLVKGYCGDGIQDLFVYIQPIEKRESVKNYLGM